jgi:CheY-like chemotaxis protein
VREVLETRGYTVLEARHPGEALLISERHEGPIHLMLTDVVMPEMSGRILADRLLVVHLQMKVLYMSGYTDDAIVHHRVLDLRHRLRPEALHARRARAQDSRGPRCAGRTHPRRESVIASAE